MRLNEFVLDQWTALSHKEALSPEAGTKTRVVWSWVGEHARRLTAYKILAAYQRNAARFFLPATNVDYAKRREYGDAALIVTQVRGALLGDDQSLVVDGADDDPPEGSGPDFVSPARERQDWLTEWAKKDRLPLKLIEGEGHAVGLGDGVYHVAWSAGRGRPTVTVYDPGFYFPVLTDDPGDEYPSTVHLAWEFEVTQPDGKIDRKVRRITWRLGPIQPPLDDAGNPTGLPVGARFRDGRITRTLPYQDEPVAITCYMTDATWELDGDVPPRVDDFDPSKAVYAVDAQGNVLKNLDLQIDFLPIVHLPNTVAGADHFGTSTLDTVLQILDDLQGTDTDLQAAASTTGAPPITISGATLGAEAGEVLTYGPGQVFNVPEGGKMDTLDTSRSLDALLKLLESLLKRLSINSRVPDAVLGRVDASQAASGIALALSFGPLEKMVNEMRLIRDEKYTLLLKMVQRLAILHGGGMAAPVLEANIAFGSYLPSDRAGVVTEVTSLRQAKVVSTETAVRMLMEAGFPIDDAQAEVERIEHENFEAAVHLLDALGDEQAVADFLGRKVSVTPPEPIQITPPPVSPTP